MNSPASSAIATRIAVRLATSWIGVLTIGLPAAMYSSVLVGLMKRVASFSANGIRQTSQPATRLRQQLVRLLAEPVDVGRRGNDAGSILTTGPTITICQPGSASASCGDQAEVEALVDHAEEAQPRRGRSLALQRVRRARIDSTRPCRTAVDKCSASTALGRQQHVRMQRRACDSYRLGPPVSTRCARFSSARLALAHLARRVLEGGQLVHAVVDDARGARSVSSGSAIGV